MSLTAAQFEIPVDKDKLNVSVTVSSVQHGKQRLGYVIVFEDFSELLKAQREAAWREVARRVAHEIKNPLTPIALSAERIRRHLERGIAPDQTSLAVIHGCAETISRSRPDSTLAGGRVFFAGAVPCRTAAAGRHQ